MKSYTSVFFVFIILLGLFAESSHAQAVLFGTGKMQVRVDSYGAMRFWTIEGTDTIQHLNRVNILVAGNPNQVLDYWNDVDVEVPNSLVSSPAISDYEISGVYNNTYSSAPPNVLVAQNVYGWTDGGYIIVKMVVTNKETAAIPTILGLDVVQYVDFTWEDDNVFYDMANQMLVQYENHYIAIKYLSEAMTSAVVLEWYDGYSDVDADTYARMTSGTFNTDTLLTDADGAVAFLAGQSVVLQPEESRTLYIAVAAGANESEMLSNMQAAQQKYSSITSVEGTESLPTSYVLEQNYPNPFNPATKISWQSPVGSHQTLKIYDMLGNEVATLVDEFREAGRYEVEFQSTVNSRQLASGVYFYRLQAGDFVESNKMILLK